MGRAASNLELNPVCHGRSGPAQGEGSERRASRLEVKLQGELNLTRIVGSVTSGSDLSKAWIGEVSRTRNGDNAVSAKVRLIEVRMVRQVEDLGPKLQVRPFGRLELLEE